MKKVSIIIPTYNVEQYLRECLDSIVKQTEKEIEIICVNDGSTDASLDIIKEYALNDGRIIVISGPNGGYGKAMNKGLERATGEYIGIVEPDDFVALNMYEELYKEAKKYDADLVKADFYRFTREENGNMNLNYNHLSDDENDYGRVVCPVEEQKAFRFIMNTWSGIYKREFIEKYQIRHNETPGASYQDNGFWFQTFMYAKKAVFINRPYYYNRRDNPNSSMFNKNKVYAMNVEYAYIKRKMKQNEELWEKLKYTYTYKCYQNYISTINRIAPEFKKQYVFDICEEFRDAEKTGELSETAFSENEWKSLQFIKEDPENYYFFNVLPGLKQKELQEAINVSNARIKELENSTTYKVGRIIMCIPCAMKNLIIRKK